MNAFNAIERKIDRKAEREGKKVQDMYKESIIVKLPEYNAEIAVYINGNHAISRIYDRCYSDAASMSNKINSFFEHCSDDVLFELLVAAQEMDEFGVYTQQTAFVFKPVYFDAATFGKKRVSIVTLKTCADEASLGYKFKFKDVAAVFEENTVTDENGNVIV